MYYVIISSSLSRSSLLLLWAEASPTSQLRRENDVLRMQAGKPGCGFFKIMLGYTKRCSSPAEPRPFECRKHESPDRSPHTTEGLNGLQARSRTTGSRFGLVALQVQALREVQEQTAEIHWQVPEFGPGLCRPCGFRESAAAELCISDPGGHLRHCGGAEPLRITVARGIERSNPLRAFSTALAVAADLVLRFEPLSTSHSQGAIRTRSLRAQ